jgi:predicted DNA-binding transcriptional regulator YafY
MSKSDRLLQMMQLLRTLPAPVKALSLSTELEVSLRTVYRDVDSLRAAGAMIDGEAGYGYTLVEDPALPPMMFTLDEVEAMVLGLREVQEIADPVLADAAKNVLSKVAAGLPKNLQNELRHSVLHVKNFAPRPEIFVDVAEFRRQTRMENELQIGYTDAHGAVTKRAILPLSIVYMMNKLVVIAHCQLRQDFRAFRMDRIANFEPTGKSFKPKRVSMLRDALATIADC